MTTIEKLEKLKMLALEDVALRKELLESADAPDRLSAFCNIAGKYGLELYPMDVVDAGEEFHAAMKRSTNGGGENSPALAYQDDFYAMFMSDLAIKEK